MVVIVLNSLFYLLYLCVCVCLYQLEVSVKYFISNYNILTGFHKALIYSLKFNRTFKLKGTIHLVGTQNLPKN